MNRLMVYSGRSGGDGSGEAATGKFTVTVAVTDLVGFKPEGEWAPSVASVDSVLDPYNVLLALTYCHHVVHLDPIHKVRLWCRSTLRRCLRREPAKSGE
jgi:hypothetical protein